MRSKVGRWTVVLLAAILLLEGSLLPSCHGQQIINSRRPGQNRQRFPDKPILKDSFYEDSSFVVRIRTTYNQTTSIVCNAVVMEDQLVLSDITCIKYQGMANIDPRYVFVIAGEANNETVYEVDQIYTNKADPRDPGTELALLRLTRPIKNETACRTLIKPEKNHSIEFETAVRVIGYTSWFELKENRTRVARKNPSSKYICTTPADLNDTPGSYLLKGAPLLQAVDCRQYQLVGILTKLETILDPQVAGQKKHQDCYAIVSLQIKWYDQVRQLTQSLLGRSPVPGAAAAAASLGAIVAPRDDRPPAMVAASSNQTTLVSQYAAQPKLAGTPIVPAPPPKS